MIKNNKMLHYITNNNRLLINILYTILSFIIISSILILFTIDVIAVILLCIYIILFGF